MFRQNLTGIKKGWCHAQKLVIISLVFIDPNVTYCIVLIHLNAANCRPWKINEKFAQCSEHVFNSNIPHKKLVED